MEFLNYFRRLYTLNTLDTRFTTSSNAPQKAPNGARVETSKSISGDDSSKRSATGDTQPSKWNTPEFYVYYLVFIVAIPSMFKAVYDVSKCMHL